MDGQFRIDATTYFQYTTRAEARLTATERGCYGVLRPDRTTSARRYSPPTTCRAA